MLDSKKKIVNIKKAFVMFFGASRYSVVIEYCNDSLTSPLGLGI